MKRGYSLSFLKTEIRRVHFIPRCYLLTDHEPQQQKKASDRTPFIITFNPALCNPSFVVRQHLNILQSSTSCKQIFPSPPVVTYRRKASLRDLLVHTKLKKPTNEKDQTVSPAEAYRCNHPRCLTCQFIKQGQKKYIFFSTKEERCQDL